MMEQDTFNELIKGLDPFDRKLVYALDELRMRHKGLTLQTSRFELCHLLGLEYSSEHAALIDASLERLKKTPLYQMGPQAGFSLATRAVTSVHQEEKSEKLTFVLGRLYRL